MAQKGFWACKGPSTSVKGRTCTPWMASVEIVHWAEKTWSIWSQMYFECSLHHWKKKFELLVQEHNPEFVTEMILFLPVEWHSDGRALSLETWSARRLSKLSASDDWNSELTTDWIPLILSCRLFLFVSNVCELFCKLTGRLKYVVEQTV